MSAPTLYFPVPTSTAASPPQPLRPGDSDLVFIIASILFVLICVVALIALRHCDCIRRLTQRLGFGSQQQYPPNRGLKRKIFRSLPKTKYVKPKNGEQQDCAICLMEFGDGDDIRILPHCGHVFHLLCIDIWLRSHSSCPSCRRRVMAMELCNRCGGVPETEATAGGSVRSRGEIEAELNGRQVDDNGFLP